MIKTRRMRWAGHEAHMGGAYRVSLGTAEGKRQPGRPRLRWEDILKWIFKTWNGEHELD